MTERQQDAPGEPEPNVGTEEPIEDASQADPAEGGETDAELDAEDAAEVDGAATEASADDEVEAEDAEAPTARVPAAPRPGRSWRGRPTETGRTGRPVTTPGPTPSDQAVHIDDRVSQAFVLVTVAVFAIIFANAMILGKGGTFSAPSPSPTEEASGSPGTSESPSPSGSAEASESASPAPSTSPAASESPAAGTSPSVAPSPSS
jgi:hypothetical protein